MKKEENYVKIWTSASTGAHQCGKKGFVLKKELYTVADISRITGYNRSTVTRWLDKQKIKNAQMQGNAPVYDAQVLEKFKKTHNTKQTKTDKKDELIKEKDARISALSDEIQLLKKQLEVKDEQIKVANQLADQAQKLNLADKPQLTHKENEDKKVVAEVKKEEPKKSTPPEETKQSWLGRIFGRK